MEEHKCAFSAPLITHQFGCNKAAEVTRRGGPDIACTDGAAAARCEALFSRLKVVALPAFGVEDDLLSMPHSVLVKIQYGGPLGLQRLLGEPGADRVEDIDRLAVTIEGKFGEAIPVDAVVPDITAYKPRARRGR
jgi:hypothetical protein